MKVIKKIRSMLIDTKTLFKNNKEAIDKHNKEFIPKTLLISALIMVVPLIFSIFRISMQENVPAYLITLGAVLLLMLLFRFKKLQSHYLFFAYALAMIYFVLASYLSLIQFSSRPAGTALTFFIVVPLLVVDRSWRINIFIITLFIVHAVASFYFKGQVLGSVDLLNTFVSISIGILFGRLFLLSHLNTFEMSRLLIIEKETDFLTGLANRRRLDNDFNKAKIANFNSIGILMIDIDDFKKYNDTYGHNDGDLSLIEFSGLLLSLEIKNKVKFYRYGGEEFIGLTVDFTKEDLIDFAEDIRIKTMELKIPKGKLTISIGLSQYHRNKNNNIDNLILSADQALYKAKQKGRNCVDYTFSE